MNMTRKQKESISTPTMSDWKKNTEKTKTVSSFLPIISKTVHMCTLSNLINFAFILSRLDALSI